MITTLLLALLAIIAVIVLVTVVLGGAAFIGIFGDLIIAILIISLIVKLCRRKKK